MGNNTIIYVTDDRQRYLAHFLRGKKVQIAGCNEVDFGKIDRVIFPTPFSKLKLNQNEYEQMKYELSKYQILVFGGVFPVDWNVPKTVDFMKDELVASQNAEITAEATVSEILQNSVYGIKNEKILIAGFGKCGKELAKLLNAMGAKVTILARSRQARIQAKEMGLNAVDFSYGPDEAYGTRVLVNTVPAMVITKKIIDELAADSLIVDIASGSGGCDRRAVDNRGVKFIHALSLPSRYITKTSAKVMYDCVVRNSPSINMQKEGDSWIYLLTP